MFDVKKQLRWSKIKVGLVITVALFSLLIAVFFAGNIEDLFTKKVEIKVEIPDVKGLRKGAPVWLFGTEVGFVKNIQLSHQFGTIVAMEVNKNALGFIRKDARASILTMGLLGDKYLDLSPGSPSSELIQPGEMIRGKAQIELQDVIATSVTTIEKMTEFIERLDTLLTKIETGQGTIAKFLGDPSVYDNLDKATSMISLTLQEIRNSRGTLKLFLEDPSFYNKMLAAASNLEEFTRTAKDGSGTLKKLIEDPSLYEKLSASASHIEEFSKRLGEAQGTLKKLVEDPELYENLNRGSILLSSILGRIDKGEGTVGALIRNEEVFKELGQALAEAKKLSEELEALLKDIKQHPKKYFKFSIF